MGYESYSAMFGWIYSKGNIFERYHNDGGFDIFELKIVFCSPIAADVRID